MNKAAKYQDNIRRSLREQWEHIEKMVLSLPEGEHLEWDDLSDKDKRTVDNVKAIEEEWIIDPEIRAELTVLPED